MHLIQDTAQPAHVRNDAHPIDGKGWEDGLETWAKKNLPNVEAVNSFASTPTFPQVALNINYDGYAPITQFIDTKQYVGSLIPDTSLTWGLSEYTNSNFVSDDTIFTDNFSQSDEALFSLSEIQRPMLWNVWGRFFNLPEKIIFKKEIW